MHLVKILRLHRDRNYRHRRLPPYKVGSRLDRPNTLPPHKCRRTKQPRLVQLNRPIHPLTLGSRLRTIAGIADVYPSGCLGSNANFHPYLVNTGLWGKKKLRHNRLDLLRPSIGSARRRRQEKTKFAFLVLRTSIRLVGDLFCVTDTIYYLTVRITQIQLASFAGQTKIGMKWGRKKTQTGYKTHVGATTTGVKACNCQNVFPLAQKVHMS